MKTLPVLKEDMIKELIPSIGHRARFISNLDEWRIIIAGIQNTTNTVPYIYIYLLFLTTLLSISN